MTLLSLWFGVKHLLLKIKGIRRRWSCENRIHPQEPWEVSGKAFLGCLDMAEADSKAGHQHEGKEETDFSDLCPPSWDAYGALGLRTLSLYVSVSPSSQKLAFIRQQ